MSRRSVAFPETGEAPTPPAATAPPVPAGLPPLPAQGGAWLVEDGRLVRDPATPQASSPEQE